MKEALRLARRLAQEIGCSRSQAEQYIEGGWVLVDGQVCEEPGMRIASEQQVSLAPDARSEPAPPVTILFHKPAGMATGPSGSPVPGEVLCALGAEKRSRSDHSGIRPLKKHHAGLQLTAALEPSASGLVVLTQDWRVARRLVQDAARIEYEYIIETGMQVTDAHLAAINRGMTDDGRPAVGLRASRQSESRLRVVLKTPPPGLLQALCAQAGLAVLGMRRLRIGRVPLAGLDAGQWSYLPPYGKF